MLLQVWSVGGRWSRYVDDTVNKLEADQIQLEVCGRFYNNTHTYIYNNIVLSFKFFLLSINSFLGINFHLP